MGLENTSEGLHLGHWGLGSRQLPEAPATPLRFPEGLGVKVGFASLTLHCGVADRCFSVVHGPRGRRGCAVEAAMAPAALSC